MFRFLLVSALVAIATASPAVRSVVPRLDGRIVGGSDYDIGQVPHQVSLQYYGSHICGGSILGKRYVVTAAHCTDGSSASSLSIRYGTSLKGSGGTVVKVQKIHQHPKFSMYTVDYDISVLELAEDVKMTAKSEAVELAISEPTEGTNLLVTGWGALKEGGSAPKQLQGVKVPAVDREDCKRAYGSSSITDRMICAGFTSGGKDACQGDSGGPLVIAGTNEIVGVVSWGYGCARPNYPGVYSNVAKLRSFVIQTMYS